jgi:hypothetical protein
MSNPRRRQKLPKPRRCNTRACSVSGRKAGCRRSALHRSFKAGRFRSEAGRGQASRKYFYQAGLRKGRGGVKACDRSGAIKKDNRA